MYEDSLDKILLWWYTVGMRKNHLNILAIEGVQGAGKTTLINKLIQNLNSTPVKLPLISKIERPRTFNQWDNGAGLSLITDFLWYTSAVKNWFMIPDNVPRIIDRFIISQWVYGKLRKGIDPTHFTYSESISLIDSLDEFIYAFIPRINQEYRRRVNNEDIPYITHTNLVYLFLLPTVDIINHRRKFSQKKYTFSAVKESAMYLQAYDLAKNRKDITCIYLNGLERNHEVLEKINEAFLSLSS